jgi:hypothetical protein
VAILDASHLLQEAVEEDRDPVTAAEKAHH